MLLLGVWLMLLLTGMWLLLLLSLLLMPLLVITIINRRRRSVRSGTTGDTASTALGCCIGSSCSTDGGFGCSIIAFPVSDDSAMLSSESAQSTTSSVGGMIEFPDVPRRFVVFAVVADVVIVVVVDVTHVFDDIRMSLRLHGFVEMNVVFQRLL